MQILKETINTLCVCFKDRQREYGGIIGGFDDIISEFQFDKGMENQNTGCYIPNIEFLNDCIEKWQNQNISFYGIIHNHIIPYAELSNDDVRYIEKIMLAMSDDINVLYFPVISSENVIKAFKAVKKEIIVITEDTVIVV